MFLSVMHSFSAPNLLNFITIYELKEKKVVNKNKRRLKLFYNVQKFEIKTNYIFSVTHI